MKVQKQLKEKFGRALQFEESSHSYHFPGKDTISVTRLIKHYTREFDSQLHAERVAKKLGVTTREILDDWERIAKISTDIGSSVHEFFYKLLFEKDLDWQQTYDKYDNGSEEYEKRTPHLYCEIMRFWTEHKEMYIPEAGETAIVDFDSGLCGTFDLLFRNRETGELELFDIKTNKKFTESNKYGEKLLPPVSHLDNCETNKYSLQLSFYKYILEKELSLSIPYLNVLWLEDTYHIIPLRDLSLECKHLLSDYMVGQNG